MNPFEFTMRLFFGDMAYHTGDESMIPTRRRHWLKKAFGRVIKDLGDLESSPEHRHLLLMEAEDAQKYLPRASDTEPSWGLVYHLLAIIAYLLGYQLMTGRKYCSAVWYQTSGQYFGRRMQMGQSYADACGERKTAIAIRARIAEELRNEGYNDFQISMVLNVTDYEVRRLKSLRPSKDEAKIVSNGKN